MSKVIGLFIIGIATAKIIRNVCKAGLALHL